ncbi:MAG: hypothetical protein JO257_10805 [Deltaproteobacteria bacterium]|nr:hypothetical protein [Deltaproteobacteria bacterium]
MKKTLTRQSQTTNLTRKAKLRVNAETVRVLTDTQLDNVGGGGAKYVTVQQTSAWCSVGAFVGGCR